MKNLKSMYATLFFISALVFTSCSSNNNDDDFEEQQEELSEIVMQDFADTVNNLAVPAAMQNSNDSYAQQALAQFTVLQTLSGSFTEFFTVPGNAVSAKSAINLKNSAKSINLNTQTYTWVLDGLTVTYIITEQSDRYTFSYALGSARNIVKIMDGYQLKNGNYAEVILYDENVEISKIKWSINSNITTIELIADTINYILESNTANNSGNLKLYESNTLYASYIWAVDGSGSYTDHVNNQTFTW